MIHGQLLPGGIQSSALLEAMASVPRERFVDARWKDAAYLDDSITCGEGRALPAPLLAARLLEAGGVTAQCQVLELAAGTGYHTALLAHLAASVVAVEPIASQLHALKENVRTLNLSNVQAVANSVSEGYAYAAPYDVIFALGQVGQVPQAWFDQLAQGGRLITVLAGASPLLGEAFCFTRGDRGIVQRRLGVVAAPAIAELAVARGFAF